MARSKQYKTCTIFRIHPAVAFFYFLGVIGITMVVREPLLQVIMLVCSWCMEDYLNHGIKLKVIRKRSLLCFMIVFLGALINGLTYHDGVTILLYINDNPITGEALLYGATFGIMLVSAICWFRVYEKVITQEKFLYLFGRIAPSLALTISMIFRYIPLLKRRYNEIHLANEALGAYNNRSAFRSIGNSAHEFSVLVSWSLEESIETARQMEAKGYGYGRRSSYHRFVFTKMDRVRMVIITIGLVAVVVALAFGGAKAYFYPTFEYKSSLIMRIVTDVLTIALMGLPLMFDVRRNMK